jgi:hypothetical protein
MIAPLPKTHPATCPPCAFAQIILPEYVYAYLNLRHPASGESRAELLRVAKIAMLVLAETTRHRLNLAPIPRFQRG